MKHAIAVLALIAAFYLGAHSQNQGPTFVTGLSIYGGKPMTGQIHLTTDSNLTLIPTGDNEIRIGIVSGYHLERDK